MLSLKTPSQKVVALIGFILSNGDIMEIKNCEKCKHISYHGWQVFCKKAKHKEILDILKRPRWCPSKKEKTK